MEFKKITKVSIFVDYDNFTITYCKKHKFDETEIPIWDSLSDKLLDYYRNNFIRNNFEVIDHTGTYICVGMSDYLLQKEERDTKKGFKS